MTKTPEQAVIPAVCDGIEQDAFEAWATAQRYDMATHPLHWLFLNEKTDAARQGWKAGLEHAMSRLAHSKPASEGLREALEIAYGFAKLFNRRSDASWAEAEDRILAALQPLTEPQRLGQEGEDACDPGCTCGTEPGSPAGDHDLSCPLTLGPIGEDRAEKLMREFYLSPSYNPRALRHADTVQAAIRFVLSTPAQAEPVAERAAIVAWLRQGHDAYTGHNMVTFGEAYSEAADAIEQGLHHRAQALADLAEGDAELIGDPKAG